MSGRVQEWSDQDVESALLDLREHVAYPPTPDVAAAVAARLRARPVRATWWGDFARGFPRSAAAAGLAFLLGLGVLVLVPEARTAVADRLGLRGVTISHGPSIEIGPRSDAPAAAGPVGARLALGERLSLEEARARVAYPILLPTLPGLGNPDEVYLSMDIPGGQVAFVYLPRSGLPTTGTTGVGLLLTQFQVTPRGEASVAVLGKTAGPGTQIRSVTVNGSPGYWIDGNPHEFYVADRNGVFRAETVRLAGSVLLWEQNRLTLRIESALPQEQALAIAASVR